MKRKTDFFVFFTIIIFFTCFFLFPNYVFGAYPKLVNKLTSAFESVKEWIIKIATPAAAVAVRHRCFYEKI